MSSIRDIIIALDEGTTNAKAVALDIQGNVLAKFSQSLSIDTPQQGWVEQSGEMLISASVRVIAQAIEFVGAERIAALAISNQRETAIGWYRRSGKPLGQALTWQCSRTAEFCEQLRTDALAFKIKSITGLPTAPLFSASKMRWLLESVPNGYALACAGEICLGTIDAWLLWNLTAGQAFCCDYSNASRTQLQNIHTGEWDPDMLAIFNIPSAALPEIKPSSAYFGQTLGVAGIPDGIPILAMVGDSHGALFGHALGQLGCVKATYGTGSSIMAPIPTAQYETSTLATTIAWHDNHNKVFALEGNIPHTGDAVAWMVDSTGLGELPKDKLAKELNLMPAKVPSSLGVYFVPALTGLGAPWWDENARGVICGLSRGVKREHLIRAALESITYQIADVIETMRQHPDFTLSALMVDGGPTQNDWLMQYQADLLGCTVMRSNIPELSAIGAGLLAIKFMDTSDYVTTHSQLAQHTQFTPDPDRYAQLQTYWNEWQTAVARCRWQPNTLKE